MLRAGAGPGGCKRAECTELKPRSPARIQFVECPTKQGAWESITLPSGPVNGLEWEGLARTSVNVQVFSAEDSPLTPRKRSGSDKRVQIEPTSSDSRKTGGREWGKNRLKPYGPNIVQPTIHRFEDATLRLPPEKAAQGRTRPGGS